MGSRTTSLSTFLLIVTLIVSFFSSFVYATVSNYGDDQEAMDSLKDAITSSTTQLNWEDSDYYCNWDGIVCDTNQRVISIDLCSKSIASTLPSSINYLSSLEKLALANNNITALPSLANLSSLRAIYLSNNSFLTISPDTFSGLDSLQVLYLSNISSPSQWDFPPELADSKDLVIIEANNASIKGQFPVYLANLSSLKNLSLSHNNLTGTVPANLTSLPNIRLVDISYNQLSGPTPEFPSSVIVRVAGNSFGVTSSLVPGTNNSKAESDPSGRTGKRRKTIASLLEILLPVIISVVFVMLIIYVIFLRYKEKKYRRFRHGEPQQNCSVQISNDASLTRYRYQQLKVATNNFDQAKLLGSGGFGKVYKGQLKDGTLVAVKKIDPTKDKSFKSEVRSLRRISHPHIVTLIGYCSEKNVMLVVYEYMSKGSLDKWIFEPENKGSLNWNAKKKILLQIAMGLEHMHEHCGMEDNNKNGSHPIWHRDIKPENVLLDDSFNAKLADFGLAKVLSKFKTRTESGQRMGTLGYMAPEIWQGGSTTNKVDVFSYGVVVLETVFESNNICRSQIENGPNLFNMAKRKGGQGQLLDFITDTLGKTMKEMPQLVRVVNLALWCLNIDPKTRPSMKEVVPYLTNLDDASIPEGHYIDYTEIPPPP